MNRFQQPIAIRWSDLDPNGHVRHSVYYDFGAQARMAYLQQGGFSLAWMNSHGFGPVLFREEARFRRELHLGDSLTIDLLLSGQSVDGRKWGLRHHITRGDELCAVLDLEGGWLDLQARRLAVPPPAIAAHFAALPKTDDYRVIVSGKTSTHADG